MIMLGDLNMHNLKTMTIVGTRPEIIRLSRVIALLSATTNHRLVHTGQNWDRQLNDVFFDDLQIAAPDFYLDCDTTSLGSSIGSIISKTEQVFKQFLPDALIVLGDTNSALSAIMARRLGVPIYHMEAGNRSFDRNVPEETNRKIVDHIADFNITYTEHARRNLISEGLPNRRIYKSGSPMLEVIEYNREKIVDSKILDKLQIKPGDYVVASIHRQENVDDAYRLKEILKAFDEIANQHQKKIIVSTHPRTKKNLEDLVVQAPHQNVIFSEPFGYFDYMHLQQNSSLVISDSGSIAEESALLGFPAITPRDSIERPEALDAGSIMTCAVTKADITEAVNFILHRSRDLCEAVTIPEDYLIKDCSRRVVNLIQSTARITNSWDGIRTLS